MASPPAAGPSAQLPPLPNPETPLAFLPPTLASQFEVSRYLLVATCGMFSWDLLTNIRSDYRLLTKHRISLPTVVYFASRVVAFSYIISSTAFQIGPVGNCQSLQVAVGWTFAGGIALTALLFFFRVQAIFNHDKWIVAFFSFMWLATLAGSMTVPFAITGSHIGPTNHCINTGVKPFSSVGIVVSTVNDTLVFIFITIRLLWSTSYNGGWKARLGSFFNGNGLPAFSRTLLQTGQEYYFITVAGNILTMGMILAPNTLPAVYHAMFTVPNMAIANSMACRVYRDIKFGRLHASVATIRSGSATMTIPSFVEPRSKNSRLMRTGPYGTDFATVASGDTTSVMPDIGIHVTKTVYREGDVPMEVMFPRDDGKFIPAHGQKISEAI